MGQNRWDEYGAGRGPSMQGAHILIATGSEVSIFIRQDTVLTHFDQTIQQVLTQQMEQHSVSIVQDPNRNNSAV